MVIVSFYFVSTTYIIVRVCECAMDVRRLLCFYGYGGTGGEDCISAVSDLDLGQLSAKSARD